MVCLLLSNGDLLKLITVLITCSSVDLTKRLQMLFEELKNTKTAATEIRNVNRMINKKC